MTTAVKVAGAPPANIWHDVWKGVKVFVPGTHESQAAGEGIVHGAKDTGKAVIGGTEALGKVAVALVDPHTWVRVGEILVGSILLIAGIDHMFNTNISGKAAKIAPFLM